MEKRLEGSPGFHILLTDHLRCSPPTISSLDYSSNFPLSSGSFFLCQCIQLDFSYPKVILQFLLSTLFYFSLTECLERKRSLHSLLSLSFCWFLCTKALLFSALLFSKVTTDLFVAKFDGYFLVLILLGYPTFSSIIFEQYILWRISKMYKCKENKWRIERDGLPNTHCHSWKK